MILQRKKAAVYWGALLLCGILLLAGRSARAAEAETQPDWTDSMVIAHCLGQVDGQYGTNSREAFLQSCDRGIRVLETDFSLTSDGVLAVRHDFEANSASVLGQPGLVGEVSALTHLNTPILGRYKALTAGSLLTLMREYPDVWVVTDTKETDPELVRRAFELLVDAADTVNARSALDRLVIQVYSTDMKEVVEAVYPFQNWIMTVYQLPGDSDYAALADYCAGNGISVMAVPTTRLTGELVRVVHDRGLKLYVHTLNDPGAVGDALALGVDGIYSDALTDSQVRMILTRKKVSLCMELFRESTVKLLARVG